MGASSNDKFANSTERPTVRVQIEAFAIGCTAVTVGEYRLFSTQHSPDDDSGLPAVAVNWNDASDYCAWLAQVSGLDYRLPSEAEWEYACRAGTETPFYTGHQLTIEEANYFYDESGTRVGPGRRMRTGSFPANPWGLYEMHGNISEWCADAWNSSHTVAGQRGLNHELPINPMRAIRGGGWDYLPRLLRSSWRDGLPPDTRRDNLGFRIACTLSNLP